MAPVAATPKEIRKAFYQEYLGGAVEGAKGLTKLATRIPLAIGATLLRWQKDPLGGFKMLGAGVLALGAVVAGSLAAPPALLLGVVGATTGLGLFSGFNIHRAASVAFKTDLDNGTLAARYDAEIVKPKAAKSAPASKAVFLPPGTVTKSFQQKTDAAVAVVPAVAPAVVPTATPTVIPAAAPAKAATPVIAAPETPK